MGAETWTSPQCYVVVGGVSQERVGTKRESIDAGLVIVNKRRQWGSMNAI
jgi:hypothetical protein